jgi:SNF2 family DNA or RNA helicase
MNPKTRKIILSGTAIKNNLAEYYHLLNWLRPNCLGLFGAFETKYVDPIKRGSLKDSSPQAIQHMKIKIR